MKPTIIQPDGKRLPFEFSGKPTLESMQNVVGGLIEFIRLPDKTVLVANEEGLCLGLPFNQEATFIVNRAFKRGDGFITGNAIHLDQKEIDD